MPCKIIVVADSHGSWKKIDAIIQREQPVDALVHCGDGADDLDRIVMSRGVEILRVAGNMDRGKGLSLERLIVQEVCGKRFMIAHGDLHRVERDLTLLLEEGILHKADIVCFGHTHMKFYHEGYPALFNPGPANSGLYGVITTNGDILCEHRAL